MKNLVFGVNVCSRSKVEDVLVSGSRFQMRQNRIQFSSISALFSVMMLSLFPVLTFLSRGSFKLLSNELANQNGDVKISRDTEVKII